MGLGVPRCLDLRIAAQAVLYAEHWEAHCFAPFRGFDTICEYPLAKSATPFSILDPIAMKNDLFPRQAVHLDCPGDGSRR